MPRWEPNFILFKEPNILYAVDELDAGTTTLRLIQRLPFNSNEEPSNAREYWNTISYSRTTSGSSNGNHLVFNADKTRMVETCYMNNFVCVWDVSGEVPRVKKRFRFRYDPLRGQENEYDLPQRRVGPRSAVLDPTGRFFVIASPGSDTLTLLDTSDDSYNVHENGVIVIPNLVVPEHVGFVTIEGRHYLIVLGGFTTTLFLLQVDYVGDRMDFTGLHWVRAGREWTPGDLMLTTFSGMVIAKNQRDIYTWTRFPGENSGCISHFMVYNNQGRVEVSLVQYETLPGVHPRMVNLSADEEQKFLFVVSDIGDHGLLAYEREPWTGKINAQPVAVLSNDILQTYGTPESLSKGPRFVTEI
ncbi:hypothetical protein F5Y11DRAFT_361947 [Daldinia sp. FL1419]|nr:hypothetical protein F5Y11DRAFT_361947 [Daldinia sp. FL1419]